MRRQQDHRPAVGRRAGAPAPSTRTRRPGGSGGAHHSRPRSRKARPKARKWRRASARAPLPTAPGSTGAGWSAPRGGAARPNAYSRRPISAPSARSAGSGSKCSSQSRPSRRRENPRLTPAPAAARRAAPCSGCSPTGIAAGSCGTSVLQRAVDSAATRCSSAPSIAICGRRGEAQHGSRAARQPLGKGQQTVVRADLAQARRQRHGVGRAAEEIRPLALAHARHLIGQHADRLVALQRLQQQAHAGQIGRRQMANRRCRVRSR